MMHLMLIVVPDLEGSLNPPNHLNPPPLHPLQILQVVPQVPLASPVLKEVPPHLEKIDELVQG